MSPPRAVVVSPRRSFERQGYYYHMYEGDQTKNPTGRGPLPRAEIPPTRMVVPRREAAQPRNAGITSRANQGSCSLNAFGGRPSAQWIMKSSSPGYFASIDLIPSMT